MTVSIENTVTILRQWKHFFLKLFGKKCIRGFLWFRIYILCFKFSYKRIVSRCFLKTFPTDSIFTNISHVGIQGRYGINYSRMDQVRFVEGSLQKILRSPFLNTLVHIAIVHKGTCFVTWIVKMKSRKSEVHTETR